MRRTPIVVIATVAGMAGVLAFRTSPPSGGLGGLSGSTGTSGAAGTAGTGNGAGAGAGSASPAPSASGSASSSATGTGSGSTAAAGGVRSAAGPSVNYSWGVLSVKVTVNGSKITAVTIASLDDGGNSRSAYIDQASIPMLEQQAMQAQSASIQGVSGASYTSQGFQQSLQGALQKLGFK